MKHPPDARDPNPNAKRQQTARGGHALSQTPEASTRRACTALLSKALLDSSKGSIQDGADGAAAVAGIAASIEDALHELHGSSTTREYKSAGRSLAQNISRNASLRQRLLAEELAPRQLVRMDWQQLSTEEQRMKDGKVQEKQLRLATLNDASSAAEPGEYTCSECKNTACEVLDPGRRDIGKCETWGAKGNEGRGRIITCLRCNHRWEESGLV